LYECSYLFPKKIVKIDSLEVILSANCFLSWTEDAGTEA